MKRIERGKEVGQLNILKEKEILICGTDKQAGH
jgi:hypothetical protein